MASMLRERNAARSENVASEKPDGERLPLFDSEAAGWLASLAVHLGLVALLALLTLVLPSNRDALELALAPPELAEEAPLPEEFFAAEEPHAEIGALSQGGLSSALAAAPEFQEQSVVVFETQSLADVALQPAVELNVELFAGPEISERLSVQGVGSVGTQGAEGAIDRLTQEILTALEQGPTLVVWLFDQSGSLRAEREGLVTRFRRIYEELGVIEAAQNPAFARHDDKPLLTAVLGFGAEIQAYTSEPTDDYDAIEAAVTSIADDASGQENVFQAITAAADRHRSYRLPRRHRRHVMIVVFTDEAGDDVAALDETVDVCRKLAMPVYVVGRPAPFGREDAYVKWIDPDPDFDQRPQWTPVRLGPETLLPERLKLRLAGGGDDDLLDSGFGPYALTRLCYETGGLYFASHPNRRVGRKIQAGEVDNLAAHFAYFFDPEVMRRYQPDYVSVRDYQRLLAGNRAKAALVEAAAMSWTSPLEEVRTRFPKRDEASLAQDLSLSQRAAALLQPRIDALCRVLLQGEADRAALREPRWRAGYDLALGRALAVQVRTAGYNAMLAAAKQGLAFREERNNTWVLRSADEYAASSLERTARQAEEALQRVLDEHPQTPWALLARQELAVPLGWEWTEDYTQLEPLDQGGNAPPRPRPEPMMEQGPPRRNPPPL